MRATQNFDYVQPKKSEPLRDIWMRPNGEIPSDLVINQAHYCMHQTVVCLALLNCPMELILCLSIFKALA